MVENALTKVARVASTAAQGAKYIDSDGKLKIIKPTGDENYIDLSGLKIGSGSGGDNTGGGTDNPDAGADYYAGSLADGEITNRNLEWSGNDDPTKDTIITFNDDPGSKPFGQFDGIMLIGYIQKTMMTKGVLGAVSNIELNYDVKNAVKDGYFTTVSPYPIAIHSSDLVVGQKNRVPINGIGENLSGKNVHAPTIYLTYNADKTVTLNHEMGYDNDGDTAGATGANYQFIVKYITTFSKQLAVAQLPAAVNFFNGNTSGDIALTGISKYFEDSMDGLEIDFNSYGQFHTSYSDSELNDGRESFVNGADVRIDVTNYLNKIRIPKEFLISGTTYDASDQLKVPSVNLPYSLRYGASSTTYTKQNGQLYISRMGNRLVKISDGSINVSITFYIKKATSLGNTGFINYTGAATLNVVKITTYKN